LEEVSITKSVPNWIFYLHESVFLHRNLFLGISENEKNAAQWGPSGSGSVTTFRALIDHCGQ
jgi:hypothetical protein